MAIRPITPELNNHFKELGVWGDQTLYQHFEDAAKKYPTKMATKDSRSSMTYAEFLKSVQRCAWYLHKQGVQPGELVAIQVPNWNELAMVHLACNLMGAVCLPMHNDWREKEIGHLLQMTQAKVVFIPKDFRGFDYPGMIAELRPSLPDLKQVVVIDTQGDYTQAIDDLPAFEKLLEQGKQRSPNDPVNIMVSSGTTSLPKPSLWTDNNMIALISNCKS